MKDVTSTSFGYIIAFLLPGLAALYTLGLWSETIAEILRTFLTSASNIGLFLLVTATALGLGLLVTVLRWFVFERWLCRDDSSTSADSNQLAIEGKLTAFRAATDEQYRYHQFFGGITVVLPFLYLGWLVHYWSETSVLLKLLSVLLFLIMEYGIAVGAIHAYERYVKLTEDLLRKDTPAVGGGL